MTDPYEFDLVAIGSGPAGQRAAVQAAKLGKRVAVIEKSRHVGGVNVLLADGSVQYVSESIDLKPWQSLATRSGSEINDSEIQ